MPKVVKVRKALPDGRICLIQTRSRSVNMRKIHKCKIFRSAVLGSKIPRQGPTLIKGLHKTYPSIRECFSYLDDLGSLMERS